MSMAPKHGLRLALGLQILVVLTLVGIHQYTLLFGRSVILETAPVDPRSLFRGDYVVLSYGISTLRLEALPGASDRDWAAGDTAWVSLVPGADVWEPYSVTHRRPSTRPPSGAVVGAGDDRTQVRAGDVPGDTSGDNSGDTGDTFVALRGRVRDASRDTLDLEYGLEAYFVPEGSGRTLESNLARVTVEVAVDPLGGSAIRALYVDGKLEHRESLW